MAQTQDALIDPNVDLSTLSRVYSDPSANTAALTDVQYGPGATPVSNDGRTIAPSAYKASKNALGQFIAPDGTVLTAQTGPNSWSGEDGSVWMIGADGNPIRKSGPTPKPTEDKPSLASYFANSPVLAPWTTPFQYPDWTPPPAYQKPPDFKAPTAEEARATPGYQFATEEAQKALERSAAARGGLLSGGTLKDITQYSQGLADTNYQNVYGNALNAYNTNAQLGLTGYQTNYNAGLTDWTTNYNKALQNYQQAYNIFENNQAKVYNRLSNFAGMGQTAAGQLASAGLGYAGLNTNTLTNTAGSLGNIYQNQANAQAAGQVGSANAWNQVFGNLGSMADLYTANNLYKPATTSSYRTPGSTGDPQGTGG